MKALPPNIVNVNVKIAALHWLAASCRQCWLLTRAREGRGVDVVIPGSQRLHAETLEVSLHRVHRDHSLQLVPMLLHLTPHYKLYTHTLGSNEVSMKDFSL